MRLTENRRFGTPSQRPPRPRSPVSEAEVVPMRLTFGNEMECVLLQDRRLESASTYDELCGEHIIHDLLTQPLTSECSGDCGCAAFEFSLPLYELKQGNRACSKWCVDDDCSLHLTHEEIAALESFKDTAWYPIEIQSRILSTLDDLDARPSKTNGGHIHTVTAQDELLSVYRMLGKSFNDVRTDPRFQLLVNRTTGSHVHVGDENRGFTMQCNRNLLCLTVANERAIDSLHSVDRITGNYQEMKGEPPRLTVSSLPGEELNRPWSALFQNLAKRQRLGHATPNKFPDNRFDEIPELRIAATRVDVPSWMKIVRRAQTVKDIKDLQDNGAKEVTVNFNNLEDYYAAGDRSSKVTIEFRQHAGTLRGPEIIAWFGFWEQLITFCNDASEDDVDRICTKAWSDPAWTALDLMHAIGMSQGSESFKHYKHVLGFCVNLEPYADIVRRQELEALARFGNDYVFGPLMRENINARHENNSRKNVEARINGKLLAGCYGQYSTEYLAQLALTKSEREQLTVGWTPERDGWNGSPKKSDFDANLPPIHATSVGNGYYGANDSIPQEGKQLKVMNGSRPSSSGSSER